jgi:hypothetical protein
VGGVGCNTPLSCGLQIVLSAGPTKQKVSLPKGTTEEFSITIDDPAFPGTTVTFLVTTDAYGKLAAAGFCSGLCPANFADTVKVQGEWVVATLTSANGTIDITNKNGSDEKSTNQYGGSAGTNMTGELTMKGTGSIPGVLGLEQGGSLKTTNDIKLEGSRESTEGKTTDRTVAVSRVANVTSHVVLLRVTATGSNPIQVLKKGKYTQ